MPNSNKYASLLIDLDFLETQVEVLTSRFNELLKQNNLLQDQLKNLQAENEALRSQISSPETEFMNSTEESSTDNKEVIPEEIRIALKEKISSTIGKIDNYLSKL
ncbi:MAG: hypothetical protein GX452_02340 [Ignavibacteriales bacterium]|jgi:predicted  nucleic acid-binding Zn-ribbon protein|nr:hypothetical protein [Ignavibacteriaceae bacterium]NLH60228.1 hypothetical protein [Ignavibacteriales bacterium]HOJ17346.1 hypothetical protein [Ignavibacteriaceae bacterium]